LGRLAAAAAGIAFLALLGARFLNYPAWIVSLYACVGFAGLGLAFFSAFVLRRLPGNQWPMRAAVLALVLAVAAFLRSISAPVGIPNGAELADLIGNASGPLSAAATVAAPVIAFQSLADRARGARWMSMCAWTLSGAALGSFPAALDWRIGPRTFAVAFFFVAVFTSTIRRQDEPLAKRT
jgi:hypothetical protein